MFVREQPITILRLGDTTYDIDTGRASEPSSEEVILSGNIQPTPGEDLEKLPNGYRLFDSKVLFLHEGLKANDIVVYKENNYRVIHEDDWDPGSSSIPHFRYIIVKEVIR